MANGGIIGPENKTSFGKDKVTSQTSTGDLTTQPGTRIADVLVVAGGGGGGWSGLRTEIRGAGRDPATRGFWVLGRQVAARNANRREPRELAASATTPEPGFQAP